MHLLFGITSTSDQILIIHTCAIEYIQAAPPHKFYSYYADLECTYWKHLQFDPKVSATKYILVSEYHS